MGAAIPTRNNCRALTLWICIPEGQLTKFRSSALAVCGIAALALTAPAFAQRGGVAVARGSAYGGGYRGGYYGGYRGGYYGGYRGYYGYRGWYGGYYPWVWGGLGLGLYSTYWYGGIPYYYAGDTYFLWDPKMGQYGTVAQPSGAPNPPRQVWSEVIVYPKNGQTQ